MKSFSQYLAEAETVNDPQQGDAVDIIINEEMSIETNISAVTEDAVILEADAETMRIMELAGMLDEQPTTTTQSTSAQVDIKGLSQSAMEKDPRFQEILKAEQAKPGRRPETANQIAQMKYRAELAQGKTPPPAGVTVTPVQSAPAAQTTPIAPAPAPAPAAAPAATAKAPAAAPASPDTAKPSSDYSGGSKNPGGYAQSTSAAPAAAPASGSWQDIYAANRDVIGNNPNLIKPGQQLKMPDGSTYTVKPGDSLSKIAQGKTGAAATKPTDTAKAAEPAAEPQGEPGGAGLRTSAGRSLKDINRDIEKGAANIAQRQAQPAAADTDADSVAAQQNRELDQLDQLKKNAGLQKAAATPAAAATPNPWTGKDPEKAAAWAKLSPQDQKWLGNADPTDPYILARAPSQPSTASQLATGVRDLGRDIRGAFGFGPKAKQPAPAAAAPAPSAPAPSTATPGFNRQPINIEEGVDFARMLELAGLKTDQKKKLVEGKLDFLKPLLKRGQPSVPPRVEPTVAAPARQTTQPHPTMLGPDGKPLQVPVQPAVAPAAGSAAPSVPQGMDPMVWARMTPKQQDQYLDNVAKTLQKAMTPPSGPFMTGVKQAAGRTAAFGGTIAAAYGAYKAWSSYSEGEQAAVKDQIAKETADLVRSGVPESEIRSWLAKELKIPANEINDIMRKASGGQAGTAAEPVADPFRNISPNKRAEIDPDSAPAGGVREAEYQGRDVELGQPQSNTGGNSKYKVYVRDPGTGNIRKVTFGDPNMTIKRDDPERRKNFRARHGCGTPRASDRTKAAYWSCRMWSSTPVSKILKGK